VHATANLQRDTAQELTPFKSTKTWLSSMGFPRKRYLYRNRNFPMKVTRLGWYIRHAVSGCAETPSKIAQVATHSSKGSDS
jgi:hypothetical protein